MNRTKAVEYLDENKIQYSIMEYPENGPVAACAIFWLWRKRRPSFQNISHF